MTARWLVLCLGVLAACASTDGHGASADILALRVEGFVEAEGIT